MGSLGLREDFLQIIMDAEWRREKLEILLEKIDRGRVNGLGCDFFDNNLATNRRRRGANQGPMYGRVKVTFSDNTTKVLLTHKTCFNLSSCIDFIGVNIMTSFMKKCS